MSEAVLDSHVTKLARMLGWWRFHPFDSRRSQAGWPDLVLLRPPQILLRELKADKGQISPEQQQVLDMLAACGLDVGIWRPRDLHDGTIAAELAKPGAVSFAGGGIIRGTH